jgi:predicted transposase YbfD/YdcC
MTADSAMPVSAAATAAEEVLRDRLAGVSGDGELPGLLEFLAAVPDRRRVRGRRHPLTAILALACTAVIAGCRSLTAIAEHAAGASQEALAAAGVTRQDRRGRLAVPSETTIRRSLARTGPMALDGALRGWRAAAADGSCSELVAIDGKTARGAVGVAGRQVHLIAAVTGDRDVLAQTGVNGKTNEITQVRLLLGPLDVTGKVITADALHVQKDTARFIVEDKKADYLFTAVKDNQPKLFDALDTLPWEEVPLVWFTRDRGHGRDEIRTARALPVPAGLFPHAAQAILIERHVRDLRGTLVSSAAALAITSLPPDRADAPQLAALVRGHWSAIENGIHYVRDVTFGEDSSRVRTRNAPRNLAALRNHAISVLRTRRLHQHRLRHPLGTQRLRERPLNYRSRNVRTPGPWGLARVNPSQTTTPRCGRYLSRSPRTREGSNVCLSYSGRRYGLSR